LPPLEVDGDHFSIADISSPTWPMVVKALAHAERELAGPLLGDIFQADES
jgi:hypothetical protein